MIFFFFDTSKYPFFISQCPWSLCPNYRSTGHSERKRSRTFRGNSPSQGAGLSLWRCSSLRMRYFNRVLSESWRIWVAFLLAGSISSSVISSSPFSAVDPYIGRYEKTWMFFFFYCGEDIHSQHTWSTHVCVTIHTPHTHVCVTYMWHTCDIYMTYIVVLFIPSWEKADCADWGLHLTTSGTAYRRAPGFSIGATALSGI